MLELKQITKDYVAGSGTVTALKGIDLKFRSSEFVSVLGPSGCGKTTMLNIIGGLDQYTSGDLLINGVSTKEYKDRDWDSYRNHSVGFVFQSYNLIPHQTVLQNVEIALTLSGVSKAERRARAKEALEKVGLGDQLRKKPNAMSGGQMQRVAIARALVNNPDIILADEPTGALDTETSVQVMDLLKEVSKDRLVVMVTHNPELAEKYSSRIIRMLDGVITSDSRPFTEEEYQVETAADKEKAEKKSKEKKPTMSFWTAFRLSLTNLFTKKGRTTLTAFAGSIGIIGIALILAVSQGMTGYINHVQQTTLASYPLTLEAKTMDMGALMESLLGSGEEGEEHGKDAIYKDPIIGELVNALAKVETTENDLKSFKTYLESELKKEGSAFQTAIRGVQYSYDLELAVYTENVEGNIVKSDTGELMSDMLADFFIASAENGSLGAGSGSSMEEGGNAQTNMMSSMMTVDMWQELLPGLGENEYINTAITDQYELIDGGSWPNEYDEIVLIVNEKNELDDLTLYALGLLTQAEIDAIIDAASKGEELPKDNRSWSYEEIKSRTYKSILPADCYKQIGDVWVDVSSDETFLSLLYSDALELKVTGIIRPKEDAEVKILSSGIGYLSSLTEYVITDAMDAPVVQAQLASPSVDVLTGKPFKSNSSALTPAQKETQFRGYVSALNNAQKADLYLEMKCVLPEAELMAKAMAHMSANYPNRAAQQALVLAAMSEQLGVEPAVLEEYFVE
ncbi:MAG: ABC transporter ATP-binding protein, partial [Clostridia bacterium]|nr:ABC transporter ATP-binding protein [Clostridia bacterium]